MGNASDTLPETKRYRILGHPTDLAGHVAALGPAPLPASPPRVWREGFVSALEASGLSGRGGAGFPAAIKLAVAHNSGGRGVVVVNGMESEPASDTCDQDYGGAHLCVSGDSIGFSAGKTRYSEGHSFLWRWMFAAAATA